MFRWWLTRAPKVVAEGRFSKRIDAQELEWPVAEKWRINIVGHDGRCWDAVSGQALAPQINVEPLVQPLRSGDDLVGGSTSDGVGAVVKGAGGTGVGQVYGNSHSHAESNT